MGDNVFLYDHEASSAVESMNKANKPAREMAAVDVVNAIMLLLKMERWVTVAVKIDDIWYTHWNNLGF